MPKVSGRLVVQGFLLLLKSSLGQDPSIIELCPDQTAAPVHVMCLRSITKAHLYICPKSFRGISEHQSCARRLVGLPDWLDTG